MIPFRLFYERALGLIEVVNFKELGPVDAKVDSGNGAFNVLHGTDLQEYGDTVNFKTINNKGITKKIHDFININIGAGKVEKRPVVLFDIEFAGKQWKNIPFSISDRSTNEQPVLIGKDFIVKNGGVIDVTKTYNVGENTQFFFERSGQRTSQETIDKIIELRKKRLNIKEIGKILRVDRNTISKHLPPELREINLPRGRTVPQEIKDKIIELRKKRLNIREIGKILKIDASTVRNNLPQELRNIGLKTGRTKASQEQINKIIELRRQGLSVPNIGKIFGVHRNTIRNYLPPELQDIGLPGGKRIPQEVKDKIIELRKQGARLKKLSHTFNLSQSSIYNVLPLELKNIGARRGSKESNVQKKSRVVKLAKPLGLGDIKLTYDPVKSKIVTGKFVKFLRKNNSNTLYEFLKPTIGDYTDDKYGPVDPSKYTKEILDNIHKSNYYDRVDRVLPKLADMPISQFVSKLKSLNIQPTYPEIRWLKINGTGARKYETAAKRSHISMKKDLKNFAKSEAGKKITQDLRDQGKSFDEIRKALRAALNEEKRKARERGEAYIRPEFEQISGKLENRKHEFQAITPYINKMPDTIKVISLPAEYAFEKSLINAFDKNIISYGARLNEFDKIKTISQKVSQETNNRIKPYITSANVNKLIYDPGKGAFYDPTQVARGKSSISLPTDADVIDLDYLGYPGTTVNQSMSLSPDHNPFLYPVLAAKNNLKSGGLLMVTYTLIGVKGQNFTDTRAYKQSDVFDYSLQDYGEFSFKKNNVPSHVKPSLKLDDSEGSQFERYKTAVPIANLYLSGLMNCAKDKGVNIQPVYTNIYRGSGSFVMWRAVFAKQ